MGGGRLRVAAEERDLRQAPQRRHHEIHLVSGPADRERRLEDAARAFEIATPEANVTERVTGAQGSSPAPTLDDLDLGDRDRLVPPASGPGDVRRGCGHHVAAVRLLDLVRVAQAFAETRPPHVRSP